MIDVRETVDGRYMVLLNGVQTGENRDASGAGDDTFATREEAEEHADFLRFYSCERELAKRAKGGAS